MTDLERVLLEQFIESLEKRAYARCLGDAPVLCMPVGCFSFDELGPLIYRLKSKGVEVVQVKGGVL